MTDEERYANLKSNLLANKRPVKKSGGQWKGQSEKTSETINKISSLEDRVVLLEETVNGLLELLSQLLSD